jgi:hypothetical protein
LLNYLKKHTVTVISTHWHYSLECCHTKDKNNRSPNKRHKQNYAILYFTVSIRASSTLISRVCVCLQGETAILVLEFLKKWKHHRNLDMLV